MSRTVHGLHRPLFPLDVEAEHGIFVMHSMSTLMPQIEVVYIGSDDLIVPPLPIVLFDEADEFVVDTSTVRQPECRPGR